MRGTRGFHHCSEPGKRKKSKKRSRFASKKTERDVYKRQEYDCGREDRALDEACAAGKADAVSYTHLQAAYAHRRKPDTAPARGERS